MGKWDYISKETLEDLFINQNLSKPEIRDILGIPLTSIGRLLDKYNIKKSEELLKQMQSRLVNQVYVNRTEEQRLQKVEKCRKAWLHNSAFQESGRRVNSNRSEEHRAKLKVSQAKFYKNESEEHRQARIKKISEATKIGMQNMSKESKERMTEKRAETLRNRSDEAKALTAQKHRDKMKEKSQEERLDILKKSIQTKKENGTLWKSNFEKEVEEFVHSLGLKTEKYVTGYKDTRLEIDIYIPELKIGIECNGCWYHAVNGANRYPKSYHYIKSISTKEQGIELIHIWEDQWKLKQNIIKDILKARLNIIDKTSKIYARKCTIKEIDNASYRQFCEQNHIQGYRSANIRFGLFYNDQLVQIASFNRVRNLGKQNAEQEYEWVRGCFASNNFVIGGTSRLLKHFINTYKPKSILCYADWNLFNGRGYKKAGFIFKGYTGPDKFYIRNTSLVRVGRNPYKYAEYKELVKQKKLLACYGAGSLRFVLEC